MILATVKIWDINMFSQFSSKESANCWLIFLQNFFYQKGFYTKNLRDLWPKILEASKILRQFEMDRRRRSSAKNLRSFVATLVLVTFIWSYCVWKYYTMVYTEEEKDVGKNKNYVKKRIYEFSLVISTILFVCSIISVTAVKIKRSTKDTNLTFTSF